MKWWWWCEGLGVDLVSSDGSGDLDTDLPRDVDEAVMQVLHFYLVVVDIPPIFRCLLLSVAEPSLFG